MTIIDKYNQHSRCIGSVRSSRDGSSKTYMIEEVQEQVVMSSVEMVLKNADLMKMINNFLPGPDFGKSACRSQLWAWLTDVRNLGLIQKFATLWVNPLVIDSKTDKPERTSYGIPNLERQIIYSITDIRFTMYRKGTFYAKDARWPLFAALMSNVYWAMLPREMHFSSSSPLDKRTVKDILTLFGYLLGKIQMRRALNMDRHPELLMYGPGTIITVAMTPKSWGDEEDSDEEDSPDNVEDMIARKGCTAHGVMGTADLRTWRDSILGLNLSTGSRTESVSNTIAQCVRTGGWLTRGDHVGENDSCGCPPHADPCGCPPCANSTGEQCVTHYCSTSEDDE